MISAQELVDRALAASARGSGVVGCAVIVTESSEAVLRWANSTMTTNGHTTSRSWSVVSMVELEDGTGAGVVTSTATVSEPAEIEAMVRASEAAARQAGPARDAAPLPEPATTDQDWGEGPAETSIQVFGGLAEQLAEAFAAGRDRKQLLYGFASHELATIWLGTSVGTRRRWVQPIGSVELNSKAADLSSSAWGGRSTKDFTDIDVVELADDLAVRLGWGTRRIELPAGRYPTILPPSAVADLMIYLAWSMGGRPAQEGRSPLSAPGGTRVGERLTELPFTLASDPAAPGLEYEPFVVTTHSGDELSVFDNGAPQRRVEWLREGVINELAYPRVAAAEFGADFTPPPENLLLTGGSGITLEEMVGGTERGLLLTCMWYIREVDPTNLLLTGLTRDGVYLVEGGEVVGEVNNFRFNESPLDLIRRTTQVGATERTLPREWKDWFSRAAMPPMLIPDFNMSSVSKAS